VSVVPIHKAWIEICDGRAEGETERRWYVEHCMADGKYVVADFATEEEAMIEARNWELPVIKT